MQVQFFGRRIGPNGQDGTVRTAREKAARAAFAEIQNGVAVGTYVNTSDLTVEQACAAWLGGRHRIRPTTTVASLGRRQQRPLRNPVERFGWWSSPAPAEAGG